MRELSIKEIESASISDLFNLAHQYVKAGNTNLAKIVNRLIIDRQIEDKQIAKELASERGDFRTFSFLSQDLRELERL
jgi:hypothetical protein